MLLRFSSELSQEVIREVCAETGYSEVASLLRLSELLEPGNHGSNDVLPAPQVGMDPGLGFGVEEKEIPEPMQGVDSVELPSGSLSQPPPPPSAEEIQNQRRLIAEIFPWCVVLRGGMRVFASLLSLRLSLVSPDSPTFTTFFHPPPPPFPAGWIQRRSISSSR